MIDQNKIPRAFIFIDAQYLYKIQKHFEKIHNRKLKTDLHKLGTYLAKEQGIWCEEIRYFTAPPYQHPNPTPDEVQRRAGYDRLVSSLRKIPGFSVREGRCQFVEGGIPSERSRYPGDDGFNVGSDAKIRPEDNTYRMRY